MDILGLSLHDRPNISIYLSIYPSILSIYLSIYDVGHYRVGLLCVNGYDFKVYFAVQIRHAWWILLVALEFVPSTKAFPHQHFWGWHICDASAGSNFLASHPPGGTINTFVPLRERYKNTFVSSEGGGMHLYPSKGRKNYCFPTVRDRDQGVKIYVINRSKLSIQNVNIVS